MPRPPHISVFSSSPATITVQSHLLSIYSAVVCSQNATGWRSHLRHVPWWDRALPLTFSPWNSRALGFVKPNLQSGLAPLHKEDAQEVKRGRERQSSLETSMFNNPFKPPQTSFTKPHRLSLNFFVQIFAFINSPRSTLFCISASQNATGALSKCWDFTGTHF